MKWQKTDWMQPVNRNKWTCYVYFTDAKQTIWQCPAEIRHVDWIKMNSRQRSVLKRIKIKSAKEQLKQHYQLARLTGKA